ncbi:chorismate synthase [Sedimentibacter sp.]|uniref:chorismate synthase n=1 Tax=Sedimentibacter sp. TaxID=1960295 RepID=UPI000EEBC273|nr:chorismate synthase [Sedimentibacter sp.]HCX63410.1 chorismate synthase [Clostridiales bacterium]
MSSIIGNKLKISLFGESHGEATGIVIDGLPPGVKLNLEYIDEHMKKRSPGQSVLSTSRIEKDKYNIVSGYFQGKTTGTPLCALIRNENIKSEDYIEIKSKIRPGHGDYTGFVKYKGFNDYRGGGHFSGRLTAPLTFAGAIAMQILQSKSIHIVSRIKSIKDITDDIEINLQENEIDRLSKMNFPVLASDKLIMMQEKITEAKENNNSVGGVIETYILNVPAGYGEPFFDSVESKLSHMMFSIPAVKGIEFGAGFNITTLAGSNANDEFIITKNKVMTKTNNNGGILGGITNGMPIVFRSAIKPTSSIGISQRTVDLHEMKETEINVTGRHDPCIVPRVIPVINGAAALVILDLILERDGELWI